MPDYILREAALLQLRDELAKENLNNQASHYARQGIATAIGVTHNLPAADVVEVVRCKDCIHWGHDHDEGRWCWCSSLDIGTAPDFCCKDWDRMNAANPQEDNI